MHTTEFVRQSSSVVFCLRFTLMCYSHGRSELQILERFGCFHQKSVNDVEVAHNSTVWKQKCIIWSMVVELHEGKKHINLKIACLSENVFVETDSEQECFFLIIPTLHKNS